MSKKLYLGLYFALLFTFAKAQLSEGLISSYYFNGNARDTISHNHGKVRGAKLTTDRFGNKNAAYSFDGENDLINIGTSLTLKPPLLTISLWTKINSYENNKKNYLVQPFIFTKCIEAPSFYEAYSVAMYIPNKKISAGNTSSLQKQISTISTVTAGINEWYHVVYMFDVDSTFLYVNGILQQKNFKGFFSSYLETDSVVLGYAGNPEPESKYSWLNGSLDDIKLYNRLLNPNEVLALYREPNPLLGKEIVIPDQENKLITAAKEFWYVLVGFILVLILTILIIRSRLRSIIKRNKEKTDLQQKLAKMEMQALRNQMNPHFIFNAINSIQHYVLTNEKQLASKYLVKFSRLMRSVLENSKDELISLKDELQTIKLYLEIESLRFENTFEFNINLDPLIDTNSVKLPPLIMQPFVENAIWHGLLLKQGEKKLNITVLQKQDWLVIEIDDNGIGRQSSSDLRNNNTHRRSFGMNITEDRLFIFEKLMDIKANIEIVDKVNDKGEATGTQVIINIKLNKKP